ncbi:Leucine-rich repeat-containing 39 [Gossypium arboreum]|uniref:Leucine-rich repeat-containing 39 n=1 Tax=Gossypium arboreum TaxID=29729 RepID=A0A0B0P2D7_GOSAR|nr:Leucine-rich repeat-containing 39 [Gossypium arboreum]
MPLTFTSEKRSKASFSKLFLQRQSITVLYATISGSKPLSSIILRNLTARSVYSVLHNPLSMVL